MTLATVGDTNSWDLNRNSTHRLMDFTQNGVWWVTLGNAASTSLGFFYSGDAGVTWTNVPSMTITGGGSGVYNGSIFIEKDDYMHLILIDSGGPSGEVRGMYYRGTPNTNRTSYTWSTGVYAWDGFGDGGKLTTGIAYNVSPDIVAFRDPSSGWHAFIALNYYNGSNNPFVCEMVISAAGVATQGSNYWTSAVGAHTNNGVNAIDFRHTGDGKTAHATPNVYWAYYPYGTDEPLYFHKLTYSGGAWTRGAARTILSTDVGSNFTTSMFFDGTRIVMMNQTGTNQVPDVVERDEADTTNTTRTVTNPSDGVIRSCSISYDTSGNIHMVESGDTNEDVRKSMYTRGGSWGTWSTVYTGTIQTGGAVLLPRQQAPTANGGGLPVLFHDTAPTPDQIKTDAILPLSPMSVYGYRGVGIPAGIVEPFYPDDISTLKFWVDFSDVSTLYQDSSRTTPITADAQTIGGVRDKSSGLHHLSQGTASAEPAYKTGIINGRSIARFDGSNDYLSTSMPNSYGPWDLFIVAQKRSAPTSTAKTLWSTGTNAKLGTNSSYSTNGYAWWYSESNADWRMLGATATSVNVMLIRLQNQDSIRIYGNGDLLLNGVFDPYDDVGSGAMYYFGWDESSSYGDWDIAEVCAFSTELSLHDTDRVGTYLANKWGSAAWTNFEPTPSPYLATVATKATADFSDSATRHRSIDHCQNGIWWARLDPDTGSGPPKFFYSNTGLSNWTPGMTLTSPSGNITNAGSFFIDKNDYMHVIYIVDGATNARIRYRRGTPNAGRTDYTWGTEYVAVTSLTDGEVGFPASNFVYGLDVIAFIEGSGYSVWFTLTYYSAGNYWSYLGRGSVTSAGVYSYQQLYSNSSSTSPLYSALEFRHTLADDKAVQSSTPDVYWIDQAPNATSFARWKVFTYSAGSWSEGGLNNVGDGSHWAAVYDKPSIYYDGTRLMVSWMSEDDHTIPLVQQITPPASQAALTTPPPFNQDIVQTYSIAGDLSGNVILIATGNQYDLYKCVYDRAGAFWGSWTRIDDGGMGGRSATMPRMQASAAAGSALPVLYKNNDPSPDVIYTDQIYPSLLGSTADTFYPSEDGHVRNVATGGAYATARAGGGTFTVDLTDDGTGFKPWGQAGPTNPGFYEDFFAFDTSSIPDGDTIVAVVFSLNIFVDNTATVTNICQVRAHTWTAPITSSTFVTGANLSAKTLLATATSASGSRFTAGAYKDFTSTGEFIGYINKTGLTQVMVVTDRMVAGATPGDDETIHPYYVERTGTSQDPKLVVYHHA